MPLRGRYSLYVVQLSGVAEGGLPVIGHHASHPGPALPAGHRGSLISAPRRSGPPVVAVDPGEPAAEARGAACDSQRQQSVTAAAGTQR